MKKILIVAAVALVVMTGCNRRPSANLKTDADTLTYKIGMLNSEGMKRYLASRLDMDTTYMSEFYRGLLNAVHNADNPKSAAYNMGVVIGENFGPRFAETLSMQMFGGDSTATIDIDILLAGLIDALEGEEKFDMDRARREVNSDMRRVAANHLEAEYGENRKAGEKFLAENKKKEGVRTTESGLQYKILEQGTGPIPVDSQRVYVIYEGKTIDGHIFDSSYKNNEGTPTELRPRALIAGFREAILMMPVGSKWEIYIPQEIAYGEQTAAGGQIKPFSALIFEVELVDAVNPSQVRADRQFPKRTKSK